MYLLIPGRHHLLTNFQVDYLKQLITAKPCVTLNAKGEAVEQSDSFEAIVFAVTSANHSNTRRNPLPFYLRALAIEAMVKELSIPVYVYGIDDVGNLGNFVDYTIKRLKHESDGKFDCTPHNTWVICSTQVLNLYESVGFTVLPAELEDVQTWKYKALLPWDVVEMIAENGLNDEAVMAQMHEASYTIWKKYSLDKKTAILFRDSMISSDGDLTATRDYNVYVRQMDDIASLKYADTSAFIKPGRIGDIGCAVGSWIKLACEEEAFRESDFYGIEVSRHLFEICRQRKENGEFKNPFVFFSQKNAVTGLVFDANSMNTIHTSSLTHEIESYGSREDLLKFIQNRYDELVSGGVWINRDVVGPMNKEQMVHMQLTHEDGANENVFATFHNTHDLSIHLQQLSTLARFKRFANDFRKAEGYSVHFREEVLNGQHFIVLSLKDASEFLSRKDYTDNWESEMHETFCYWNFEEWKTALLNVGFIIDPASTSITNNWIVEHRWKGKATLYTNNNGVLTPLDYPPTTMFLVGVKQ